MYIKKGLGPILILNFCSVDLIIFAMQYPQLCSNTPTTYPHFVFLFSIAFMWNSINSHGIAEFCCLYVQIMHYNANNRKWNLISEYPCPSIQTILILDIFCYNLIKFTQKVYFRF